MMKKVFENNVYALCAVCGDDATHRIGDKFYCATDWERKKEKNNNEKQKEFIKDSKKVFKDND